MATYTPNLNLGKPEATDAFSGFRQLFNDNMDILDNGGGGGSGGHTIVNENGTDMPAEGKLQFTGGVTVTDDSVNGKTVVDISGGGGNVYGAFIDTNRVLATYNSSGGASIASYTATEDCFVAFYVFGKGSQTCRIYVDSEEILTLYFQNDSVFSPTLYLKKGQVLSFSSFDYWSFHYTAYGLTQGTSGIFTPIIYSDTERVVGVWRDNKPLYQRTWDLGSDVLINSNTWTNTSIAVADINFEKIVGSQGTNSGGTTFGFIGANRDQTYVQILQTRNSAISIRYLTLYYTKTTDVAGSGTWNTDGVPTVHYSTSEQVIGTWENGKPLYRRIFTTNTMNISTSAGALYSGSVTIGDYIPDVDRIFIDIGKTYITVSGVTRGLVSASQQGSDIAVYSEVSRSNCTITFTVDYTKTTD